MTADGDDPIEAYLDDLLVELRGNPRMVRRVLAEAEAHLRDAVADGVDAHDAIRRFGDARTVAAAANKHTGVPLTVLLRQLVVATTFLCSIGCAAIGVSGLIAGDMDAVFGPTFVAGDLPSITYTAVRCAEYHALAPIEPTCATAAARHHTDEVVTSRVAAGVLGIFGFAAWAILRRRWRATPATGALPPTLVPAVGAAVFGVATLTLASGAMQAIGWKSTSGMGQWLSAATVSAAVSVAFGLVLLRTLRSGIVDRTSATGA